MGAEEKEPEFSENPVIAPVLCGCCGCGLRAEELVVPVVVVLVAVPDGEFFLGEFPPDCFPFPFPFPLSFSDGTGEEAVVVEGDEAANIRSLAS